MILGHQLSKGLIDALGLPSMTRGFTLRCYTGQAVTVECEYYPDGSFQTALAQYQLVQRKSAAGAPQAEPMNFDAWMTTRTERAHRQFIERTSQHLPHERTPEQIASYVLGVSLGGID